MTLVCVPIMVEDVVPALEGARAAREAGADLVEWRIDALFQGEGDDEGRAQVARLVDESALPCIVTCRSSEEGGAYDGDDASRIALYEWLAARDTPPRYIDVELSTFERSANLRQKVKLAVEHPAQQRALTTSLILSMHDFEGRPTGLYKKIGAMGDEAAAAVHKVAFRARSLRDNLELFELVRDGERPTIALGMGEFGTMSRVLAPKFGGFLTFASLRDAAATAPGQPTVDDLLNLYRFREVGRATRVYGIMGWPVAHSLSPLVHNAGFGEMGHDGVYVPMPIAEGWEPFKATLGALLDAEWFGFAGASVTLPHKEHLVRFAREDTTRAWRIDALAKRIGAANTVVVGDDGACRVLNTDAQGVVGPLGDALGGAGALGGLRVALLGAGGAARAAAVGLVEAGALVSVSSRTRERAEQLAADVRVASIEGCRASGNIEVCAWDDRCPAGTQAVVHCTPLGMSGGAGADSSAIGGEHLSRCDADAIVFDTVYTPRETPLLALARAQGLRVVPGSEMFVAQAAAQFEAWTANRAPIERFGALVDATV